MNIESMVRDTLHSYADGAPPNAGLVAGARARADRRRARRAVVGAVAGVAVGLLAFSIPYGVPAFGPDVAGSGPPSVELAEARFDLPSFPFTPGWVPDEIGPPHVSVAGFWFSGAELGTTQFYGPDGAWDEEQVRERLSTFPTLFLQHPARPGEIDSPLQVEIYAAEPYHLGQSFDEEPITVLGRPGTRYVAEDGNVIIVWEHEPDKWVQVWADPDIAPADVERYAQELEETPLPGQAPFSFDLLPADLEVTELSADQITFEGPDELRLEVKLTWDEQAVGPIDYSPPPTADLSPDPSASVPADSSASDVPVDPSASGEPDPSVYPSNPPPAASRILLDGMAAYLLEWADGTSVDIDLDQDWILSVSGSLNQEDLLAIAGGIELEPWARPFGQPAQPR